MLKYAKFLLFLFFIPILYFNSGATDISLATISGNFVSVNSQAGTGGYSATFSSNGNKMIVAGFSGYMYQYVLTTPWNIVTASYSGRSVNVTAQGTGLATVHLTDDGTKIFGLQFYTKTIYQYELTTPYELASLSYSGKSLTITGSNSSDPSFANPYGMAVSPDASNIFIFSDFTNKVINFQLTTPGNLSTYRYANQYSYPNFSDGQEVGIGVNPAGTSMYIVTNNSDRIHWISLPSAWSATGASYSGKYLNFNSTDNQVRNLSFKRDSTVMYVSGTQYSRIYEVLLTDTVSPTISSVTSSTSNGTYKAGDSINITVNFSENVTSTGDITVTLETGSTDRTCTFTVTSASSASCTYTVQAGDTSSDLDIFSISGTIKDASNNSMSNFVPSSSLSSNKNIVIDTTLPTITDVSASPSSTSSLLTWTTNEIGSSRIYYGLNSNTDFSTAEADTSPRVTSHSFNLTNLLSCTIYKYNVSSRDSGLNETTSPGTFITTGCGVSSISTGTTSQINLSGGTITFPNSGSIGKLVIPNNYYTTQAFFQINLLDTTNFSSLASSQTLAGGNLFKLVALTEKNSTIPSFSANITFEITYSDTVANDFSEDSLKVYKLNNGNWDDKGCTVNTSLNKITCLLSDFSIYGLFGDKNSTNNSSGSTGSKVVFSKDTRCHFYQPPELTWIDFKVGRENGINGLYVYWSQIDADKINIKIDDGTGSYPWIEQNIPNNGKYFLKNVAAWQKIKIQAVNNCYPGDFSKEFSKQQYPNGWFNR
jgi:hypothetical protein